MDDFFRFPHTPHLAWLGPGQPRDDKVLSQQEIEDLLSGEVIIEEKIDGANIGFSLNDEGDLLVQSRGGYFTPQTAHRQFQPLWNWLDYRREDLCDMLWSNLVLFGEWCYAKHSIYYDALPDWFLGFDIYDKESKRFWDTSERDYVLQQYGLHSVPRLVRGHFSLSDLTTLLTVLKQSQVGSGPMEGIIVRKEDANYTVARGKLVRAEFTQAIDAHWSRQPIVPNKLIPLQ